jgi:hypothetical protein
MGFPNGIDGRLFGSDITSIDCLVRDQEVGGSNPLAPTILFWSNPDT